jgi:hypothetical protein
MEVKDILRTQTTQTKSDLKDEDRSCNIDKIYQRLWRNIKGRRLFQTTNGYIEFGTQSTLEGKETFRTLLKSNADFKNGAIVFIPPGGAIPVLLRQTYKRNFEVIGVRYVHGIMNAESLLGTIPSP